MAISAAAEPICAFAGRSTRLPNCPPMRPPRVSSKRCSPLQPSKRSLVMTRIDRRSFLKVSAAGAGGVLIGLYLQPKAAAQGRGGPPVPPPDPHNYIKIAADGTVTI